MSKSKEVAKEQGCRVINISICKGDPNTVDELNQNGRKINEVLGLLKYEKENKPENYKDQLRLAETAVALLIKRVQFTEKFED